MHWQPELSSETRASNEFRSIAGKARPCSEAPLSVGTGAGVEAFQRASPTVVRPSTAADRTQATSTALPGKANRSNVACDALLQRAAINGQLVSVTGDLSSVSLDIVEMYYDSQKSSGGGGVESVHASSSSPTNIHIIFDDFLGMYSFCSTSHLERIWKVLGNLSRLLKVGVKGHLRTFTGCVIGRVWCQVVMMHAGTVL